MKQSVVHGDQHEDNDGDVYETRGKENKGAWLPTTYVGPDRVQPYLLMAGDITFPLEGTSQSLTLPGYNVGETLRLPGELAVRGIGISLEVSHGERHT